MEADIGGKSSFHAPGPMETAEMVARCRTGESEGETALYRRYVDRLTRLVQKRLGSRLSARLDVEDVLMSAYRSLFLGLRRGQFRFRSSGDLWRLLVEISLHKLNRQVARHRASRRSIDREQPVASESDVWRCSNVPAPDEVISVEEKLQQLLSALDPLGQMVVERRLQGYLIDEIAVELKCSERTVRRQLQRARDFLVPGTESGNRLYHRPAKSGFEETGGAEVGLKTKVHFDPSIPLVGFAELKLLRQIGVGGTGKVYLATRAGEVNSVAVKFLKKRFWRRRSVIDRFLSEAKVLASLQHPNIVPLHGLGRTPSGGWFLVISHVDGPNLAEMTKHGPVAPRQAAQLTLAVASAIAFSHRCGIVHCDLKPSNILIGPDGAPLVTDFGLAMRVNDSSANSLAAAGTPAFMAPEQIDSGWGSIGPKTDIWGLGAVLHALLTGYPPIPHERLSDVVDSLTDDAELRLGTSSECQFVPEMLREICRVCLRKSPTERFPSAEAVVESLQRYLTSCD